ncbi:MAG: flavin reductase family protein [Desulfarculaceae bacterium]|jgi:flavin reductase (DIM6/NTAB) family NADH-FMN oxidoreductase RutF
MELKPVKREFALALPVVLVSTVSKDGVRNLAPYSNITPVLRSTDLIVLASWHRRDTLKNIRRTGEFVVSVPRIDLADRIMPTAVGYPPGVDEFEVAGLEEKPSSVVRPPGVAGCIAWLECRLHKQYLEKSYVLVVGQVLRLEIDDRYLDSHNGLDLTTAQPLMASLNEEGVRWATIQDLGMGAPYSDMFPGGQDPLAKLYKD